VLFRSTLFLWGSVVAALGIVVAMLVRHVPLRGGKPAAEAPAEAVAREEVTAGV